MHDAEAASSANRGEDRVPVQREQSPQVEDLRLDSLGGQRLGRCQRLVQHHPVGADRHLVPGTDHPSPSDLLQVLTFRHRPADAPVGQLVLEEEDRVRIPDGGGQQAFRVGREGRRDHFETGDVGVEGLDRLRVVGTAPKAATVGGAQHQRAGPVTGGPVADLGSFPDQVVCRRVDEVGELDLRDRPQAAHGQAHRQSGDGEFGHRGIDHPIRAEARLQAFGGAEDATQPAHVLAEDEHPGISFQLLLECLPDGLQEGQLAHRGPSRVLKRGGQRPEASPSPSDAAVWCSGVRGEGSVDLDRGPRPKGGECGHSERSTAA